MTPEIYVRQGLTHIHGASVHIMHDDVIVLMVDTKEKYPSVLWVSQHRVALQLPQGCGEDQPIEKYSEVGLDGLNNDWYLYYSLGRYQLILFFVKLKDSHILEWNDEDESRKEKE